MNLVEYLNIKNPNMNIKEILKITHKPVKENMVTITVVTRKFGVDCLEYFKIDSKEYFEVITQGLLEEDYIESTLRKEM